MKDFNGALNAIGDGINAGQRIMSFASENQILVSQSFYEVVSRMSDDYKLMFQLKGVETDKHVREHTVYHLTPPGSQTREQTVANADGRATVATPRLADNAVANPELHTPKGRWIPWLVAGAALAAVAAVSIWHFYGPSAPATVAVNSRPEASRQTVPPNPEPAAPPAVPAPAAPKSAAHAEETPAAKSEPAVCCWTHDGAIAA